MNEPNEFYKTLAEIRQELVGKVVAIPGYDPIGRVIRVDEQGAWLEGEGNSRITPLGLVFYHPVKE